MTTETMDERAVAAIEEPPQAVHEAIEEAQRIVRRQRGVEVELTEILRDDSHQLRAEGLNNEVVEEYTQAMREGAEFPPVVLMQDKDGKKWLIGGWHRYVAAMRAGKTTIRAEIHKGTKRDGILLAVGENATHGLRRTNHDKRNAVDALLRDEDWRQWGDREIARRCAVDNKTVAARRGHWARREGVSEEVPQMGTRKATRRGTIYSMNTAPIGAKKSHLHLVQPQDNEDAAREDYADFQAGESAEDIASKRGLPVETIRRRIDLQRGEEPDAFEEPIEDMDDEAGTEAIEEGDSGAVASEEEPHEDDTTQHNGGEDIGGAWVSDDAGAPHPHWVAKLGTGYPVLAKEIRDLYANRDEFIAATLKHGTDFAAAIVSDIEASRTLLGVLAQSLDEATQAATDE